MSDHDVLMMDRENDRLAELDDAIEDRSSVIYFDALNELARDGTLADPDMHVELYEALWAGFAGGIDSQTVMKLVGDAHRVSSLNLQERERRYAAIGKYIAGIVEEHLCRIADAAATRECTS